MSVVSPQRRSLKFRKWLTRLTFAGFFLAGGIEFSVILPTCWDYMRERFESEKWFYGLTLSAMSLSNLLFGPIMGALYDRTHQTRLLILILNIFEIAGNFMYFSSTSKYMVFGSRLLTGIGWSAGTVVFGELARTSTKSERTRVYSLFMSMRQFGLILGPSFNLFLRACNFRIGPFIVDSYTSPGLFMMIVWIVIELMFLFAFFNLPPVGETEEAKDIENSYKELKSSRSSLNGSISEQNIIDVTEVSPLLKYSVHLQRERQVTMIYTSHKTVTTCYGCLVYEESVLLLSILFIILFDDLVIETGLVPMAESLMNWNEIQTSVFFMIGAVVNIISLILVWRLNNRIPDRWLILFGVCLEFLSIIWLLVSFGSGERKVSPILSVVLFSIGFFSMITSLPFSWVICSSLYSKLLPMNIQGFGQGVRRSFESLAAVIGPLWAGAAFDLSSSYYPFYGVPLALVVMIIIMLLLSFKRLKSPQRLPIF